MKMHDSRGNSGSGGTAPPRFSARRRLGRATRPLVLLLAAGTLVAGATTPAHGEQPSAAPAVTAVFAFGSGLGSGSTIGPDGALYLTDGNAGAILRMDPTSGGVTTFASGLPPQVIGIGGAMDVAFLGNTAYALVSIVGPFFGQPTTVAGLYRINRDGSATVIADIGAWSTAHPPATAFFVPGGVQYALQPFRDGFLITDGHHNRVLRVGRDGGISELIAFANTVPTGLDTSGETVYVAEAGPVPHHPATGKVVAFGAYAPVVTTVASGAPLMVDAEFGRGHQLYALSQGEWNWPDLPGNAGLPASPNKGSLLRVNGDGTFTPVVGQLDRPTSLEIVGDTAFVVTLTGTVVRIDNLPRPNGS
jgi:hypothetical protein